MKSNKKLKIILIVIAVVLIGTIVYKVISANKKSKPKYSLYTISQSSDLVFSGVSKPYDSQQVFNNQMYGEVEKVHVKDGSKVKKGDVLITFVNKEIEKQIEQAQMQLEQAQSQVKYAKEDQNDAYHEYNKLVDKYNENNSIELEAQIDQLKPSLKQADRAYRQATDQLKLQQKQIEDLKENHKKTIKATISGTCKVNTKEIDNPMSQSYLVEILSDENVIEGNISEYDYDKLKKDDKVEVIPINGQETTTGTVIEVSNAPENSSNAISNVAMNNMGSTQDTSSNFVFKIKPDKPIHVGFNVQIRKKSDEIILDKSMVQEEDSKFYVYEYKDSKAVRREVQLKKSDNSYIVVSGLKSGDKIINNVKDLKDNMKIKIES